MILPKFISDIIKLINDNGFECYLVGGAVRDYILGLDASDYDLVTNIPFDKLKMLIKNLIVMKENDHRNTAVARLDNTKVEFTMFKGKNLKEDLYTRDFKMDALAATSDGKIIDYFGGIDDINNKTISLIDKDGKAIDADPLRMLRALRLEDKYKFKIDDNLYAKIIEKKDLLNTIPKERIYDEFKRIILSDNIEYYLDKYREVFFVIIPELKTLDGFNQHNDYHIYDIYTHTIKVVSNLERNLYLRLAGLFHDIGKPLVYNLDENKVGHFLGHSKKSLEIFNKFARDYKIDNKTKKIVGMLIKHHEDRLSIKVGKICNFYNDFNMDYIEYLFKLKKADILGQNPKYNNRIGELEKLEEKYINVRSKYKSIKYNGRDVVNLGYDGKIINTILLDVYKNIVCDNLKDDTKIINNYILKKYVK